MFSRRWRLRHLAIFSSILCIPLRLRRKIHSWRRGRVCAHWHGDWLHTIWRHCSRRWRRHSHPRGWVPHPVRRIWGHWSSSRTRRRGVAVSRGWRRRHHGRKCVSIWLTWLTRLRRRIRIRHGEHHALPRTTWRSLEHLRWHRHRIHGTRGRRVWIHSVGHVVPRVLLLTLTVICRIHSIHRRFACGSHRTRLGCGRLSYSVEHSLRSGKIPG